MARYLATVISQRPAEETFAYLAVFSNAADWDPGVISAEQVDPGPVQRGTRFRLVVPFLGRQLALTYEVVFLVPGSEVVLAAAGQLLRATDRILVTADGAGAVVSYEAEVVLRGPLRLLDGLLRPRFQVIGDRAAAGLAQALATSSAPPQAQ
jgi:carbon monoxide dehydrogenase subunit G